MENMKSGSELQESIGCKLIHGVLLVLELMAKYPVAPTLTIAELLWQAHTEGELCTVPKTKVCPGVIHYVFFLGASMCNMVNAIGVHSEDRAKSTILPR